VNGPQRTRTNQRRRPPAKAPGPDELWRLPAPLPDVEPVAVPHEVGALLRSLGEPPITGGPALGHYFSAVIERAAAVAVAIALSADILAQPDDD
jgi:hypothetical protein